MDKDVAAALIAGLCFVSVTTVLPLCIMHIRRNDRRKDEKPLPVSDIIARLDRMEVGMESMSAEIERIGEGQRFTTRLLSEGSSHDAPQPLQVATNIKRGS
jgi:hypothetical protein